MLGLIVKVIACVLCPKKKKKEKKKKKLSLCYLLLDYKFNKV